MTDGLSLARLSDADERFFSLRRALGVNSFGLNQLTQLTREAG
jgi:hypothetical protein